MTKATCDNATGEPVNVCELEALACDRMEPSVYDYHTGAVADERTLAENRLGFDPSLAWAAVGWLKSLTKLPMPSKDF